MATEDYVHRIGRTARSSKTGTAYTLVTNDNARHLPKLLELLKEANQEVSEDLLKMARQFCGPRYGNSSNYKPSMLFFDFI
jgi:superfamily II DNA/RNA helicase